MIFNRCEHCADPVYINERILRNGYSYHRKCQKCYLCSETNLQDSEVFQGIIICSSCSNRIFHNNSLSHGPSHNKLSKQKYRNKKKLSSDLTSDAYLGHDLIELAKIVASISSNASSKHILKINESDFSGPIRLRDLQEKSVLLFKTPATHLQFPPWCCSCSWAAVVAYNQKHNYFSDMRIAELGASTEIANMALRKKSYSNLDKVKSVPSLTKTPVSNVSTLDSDISGDGNKTWTETTYSTLSSSQKKHWVDRRIRSMVKLPFKSFKRNILRRSSLVSELMTVEEDKNILKIINMLFHEEIAEHHRRGLKRLYSTINRRNSPQKLGW
ncbi:unnamed protein product [Parnassius mnemosyne]|uniref:LIM zinc-binding domain-containing protein n=1 Tax=Parnassius mnemosyne TaxID=213953 RepID=A0AAV1LCB0_9NEOP